MNKTSIKISCDRLKRVETRNLPSGERYSLNLRETVSRTGVATLFAILLAFMGEGPNNVIQIRRDFMKSKGDAINYNLVADLSQKGLAGSGLQSLLYFGSSAATRRLEGNEEAPTVYADSVVLDQLRHAVITGGKLSEQRLAFEMRPEMKNNLAYWYARIAFDEVIFKKLSGVTFTDSQSRTLGEAAVANTNNIYGGGKTASNQLTSGDTFEPTLFRKAKEAAMTGVGTVNASNVANATIWKIRPMIIGGKPYYGCVSNNIGQV